MTNPDIAGLLGSANDPSGAQSSPSGLVSIFGTFQASTVVAPLDAPLPVVMGNVQVFIGGREAPLLYVSDRQINAVVPDGASLGAMPVVVTVRGVPSKPSYLFLDAAEPSVLLTQDGQPVIYSQRTGRLVTSTAPASPGDVLVVYATGLGGAPADFSLEAFFGNTPIGIAVTANRNSGVPGVQVVMVPVPASLAPGSYTLTFRARTPLGFAYYRPSNAVTVWIK